MKSVIDTNNNRLLYSTLIDVELLDNEILINESYNETFLKPCFNFETRKFYEGATEEEIEQSIKENIPLEVALWRIRAVLKLMNLETTVENALQFLEEPIKTGAEYIWNYGTVIERDSQTVLFIQSILNLTENEVNKIFIQAENIKI